MDNCKIIEDLLPSYCDGLTSEESNALITEHTATCPQCARLLERMSAEPKREILDHREQFRRAMAAYEQKYKITALRVSLCCMVAVLLVICIWANSFQIALLFAGIDKDHMTVIEDSATLNTGWTTQYILHETGGEYTLTTVTKHDFWNFWYVDSVESTDGAEKPYIVTPWFGSISYRWFDGMELTSDVECNFLYVGNNAVSAIEIAPEEIPGDVSVKVNQTGNLYWILITSDNDSALNQFQPIQLLLEKGFIE